MKVTAVETIQRREFSNVCGFVFQPEGPGLGTELLSGLEHRPDAIVRISKFLNEPI
jgi:hypothetical protein